MLNIWKKVAKVITPLVKVVILISKNIPAKCFTRIEIILNYKGAVQKILYSQWTCPLNGGRTKPFPLRKCKF